jgi:hypothetical protein
LSLGLAFELEICGDRRPASTTGMDIKALFDSLDKLTDILNVGRLVFYTAAGFCGVLPLAMNLRLLARDKPQPYWRQFLSDMVACTKHPGVWLAALVFGFLIASVVFSVVKPKSVSQQKIEVDSYEYQYPRLFSGGMPDKSASKDYAAWLVSEYYRYFEIVTHIPWGILLSLPVYSLYSLVYLIRAADQFAGFFFTAAHLAFALWTLGAVVGWDFVWPKSWLPKVAQPIYEEWDLARRSAIAGLNDFTSKPQPSTPGK